MAGWTRGELLEAIPGLTVGNLNDWTARRIIVPSIEDTAGTGHHRRYSLDDAILLAVAVELTRYGITSRDLALILPKLHPRRPRGLVTGSGEPPSSQVAIITRTRTSEWTVSANLTVEAWAALLLTAPPAEARRAVERLNRSALYVRIDIIAGEVVAALT